jgi:hypothetical protein
MINYADFALGYVYSLKGDPRALEPLRRASQARFGPNRSGALAVLALLQSLKGTPLEALESLDHAIRDARDAGDRSMMSVASDLAMPILIRYDDAEAAAMLLGAMEGGVLPPVARTGVPGERRAHMLQRLAERMEPELFVAAQARGATMTADEILGFVLDRIEALQARLDDA